MRRFRKPRKRVHFGYFDKGLRLYDTKTGKTLGYIPKMKSLRKRRSLSLPEAKRLLKRHRID